MQMTITNFAVAAGVSALSAFGFLAGFGGVSVVETVTAPPPARAIIPISLHWDADNQEIGQLLQIEGGPLNATWGASFWRGSRKLCGDGGSANYPPRKADEIKWMTPDFWTGDICPPIQSGDTAKVTWEWLAENGTLKSASMSFIIP